MQTPSVKPEVKALVEAHVHHPAIQDNIWVFNKDSRDPVAVALAEEFVSKKVGNTFQEFHLDVQDTKQVNWLHSQKQLKVREYADLPVLTSKPNTVILIPAREDTILTFKDLPASGKQFYLTLANACIALEKNTASKKEVTFDDLLAVIKTERAKVQANYKELVAPYISR